MNSVWKKELEGLRPGEVIYDDPESFGSWGQGTLEGERLERFRRELELFKPGVKECFHSRAAGHFRLNISEDGVALSFYQGDALSPTRRFVLKQP